MIADRISEEIFKANKLSVVINCALKSEYNGRSYSYHSEFNFNNLRYGKINIKPYMYLEVREEGGQWSNDRRLQISQFDIPDLVMGLTKLKVLISGNKLYRIEEVDGKKQFVANKELLEENTIAFAFKFGKMVIKPCITIRKNYQNVDVYEKAVSITINNDSYYAVLLKNEIIALIQLLRRLDIHQRGEILLTNYLLGKMHTETTNDNNSGTTYRRGASIFKNDTKQTTKVSSTLIDEPDDESYFGFK